MLKHFLIGLSLFTIFSLPATAEILGQISNSNNSTVLDDITDTLDDFTEVQPTNKEVDHWVRDNCENRCNGERTDCWRCSSDTLQGVEISI